MKFVGGIAPVLDKILCVVCSAIIVLFACLLAGQVALRYVWDTPLFWVEELCRFLLVYLTFLGSALAWGRRSHISIDFMLDIVGVRIRRTLLTAVDVLMLGFSGWAIYAGWGYASASMARTSISLGVATGLAYLCVPIAFAIILVQTLIFLTVHDDQAEHSALDARRS
ncbi:TRAP transporter small permease [Aurantimonas sp. A2-1-M11]|uniref:TRAP transporter small permease n=1 Tax=Aurantimonas sp. A2-1-M11 TaxID=3113712 RepID=UPI002F930BE5